MKYICGEIEITEYIGSTTLEDVKDPRYWGQGLQELQDNYYRGLIKLSPPSKEAIALFIINTSLRYEIDSDVDMIDIGKRYELCSEATIRRALNKLYDFNILEKTEYPRKGDIGRHSFKYKTKILLKSDLQFDNNKQLGYYELWFTLEDIADGIIYLYFLKKSAPIPQEHIKTIRIIEDSIHVINIYDYVHSNKFTKDKNTMKERIGEGIKLLIHYNKIFLNNYDTRATRESLSDENKSISMEIPRSQLIIKK